MDKITGRLTADATFKSLESGKTVINFTIAENRPYWDRKTEKRKDNPRYFECAFWVEGDKAVSYYKGQAAKMTTGVSVEVEGFINTRAYIQNPGTPDQKADGRLTFRVHEFFIHAGPQSNVEEEQGAPEPESEEGIPNAAEPMVTPAAQTSKGRKKVAKKK